MPRSWTEEQKLERSIKMKRYWKAKKAGKLVTKKATGKASQLKPGAYLIGNVLMTVCAKK